MERTDRRTQVLEHAQRIFARKGFHDTNVSDIVTEAGIARGTFYLYFENKRELFAELIDRALEEIRRRVERVHRGPGYPPPVEQLRTNLRRVFEYLLAQHELADILLHHASGFDPVLDAKLTTFSEQIAAEIERALQLGIDMGLVRPCDTNVTALCMLGAIREIVAHLVRTRGPLDGWRSAQIEDLAREVLDVGLRGVGSTRLFEAT